jgi:hypothetical protein
MEPALERKSLRFAHYSTAKLVTFVTNIRFPPRPRKAVARHWFQRALRAAIRLE